MIEYMLPKRYQHFGSSLQLINLVGRYLLLLPEDMFSQAMAYLISVRMVMYSDPL